MICFKLIYILVELLHELLQAFDAVTQEMENVLAVDAAPLREGSRERVFVDSVEPDTLNLAHFEDGGG